MHGRDIGRALLPVLHVIRMAGTPCAVRADIHDSFAASSVRLIHSFRIVVMRLRAVPMLFSHS
jgi:hypothetical protein